MEIEYKSANQRIISDPYNPRIFVVEWKCAGCGEWLNEDEVLWIDPETGEATVMKGNPYHPGCEPEERNGITRRSMP